MMASLRCAASRVSLEILHGTLVLLSGLASIECAKIPPPIRPRVDLARIQPILSGFELSYHAASLATDAPALRRSRHYKTPRAIVAG